MNMAFGCFFALALTSSTGAALAQAARPGEALDGTWTVKYLEDRRFPREARLELKGSSGQYRFLGGVMNRPWNTCEKFAAPVSLEQVPDAVVVTAKLSAVVKFCADRTLKLRKTGERTFEGTFDDGTPTSVTRH